MIQVQNLTHRYGDRVALANVSFEVKQGEIFGLLGPNGGGKSTLFRILSTMMTPTEGHAILAGFDVERDAAQVRRLVGVVFQTQSLDKALTVEENLRAQGHLHGLSGATLRLDALSADIRVDLRPVEHAQFPDAATEPGEHADHFQETVPRCFGVKRADARAVGQRCPPSPRPRATFFVDRLSSRSELRSIAS